MSNPQLDGATRIAAERTKQLGKWSPQHDDHHDFGDIAFNAAALALTTVIEESVVSIELIVDGDRVDPIRDGWGLAEKHTDPIDRLVIAGALIAAEIDRRIRVAEQESTGKALRRFQS